MLTIPGPWAAGRPLVFPAPRPTSPSPAVDADELSEREANRRRPISFFRPSRHERRESGISQRRRSRKSIEMGKSGILSRVGAAARWLCNTNARQRGLPLYRRLSALSRRGCASTVADTLDKWVAEGNAVRKPVLLRCATEFRRFNKHRHALELLEWLEAKGVGFSHRDQAVRLDLLGKTEGVSSAQSYFQTLEKNKYTYEALLSCYCQRGMLGEATSIFNQMKQEDALPSNTLAYNNMISLYFKLGQFERVVEVFDEMKGEHGYPPHWLHLQLAYAELCCFEGYRQGRKGHGGDQRRSTQRPPRLWSTLHHFGIHSRCGG